jgi:hypothetical protein
MNSAQYCVVFCEHDSMPWRDDHLFTRAGAWKRLRSLARDVVPGWPHPIWFKVWRTSRAGRVLVHSGDLRDIY